MITLQDLIFESVPSNNSILYRIGCLNFNHQPPGQRKSIMKSYHITKNNHKKSIIDFVKKTRSPLPKPADEIIPRDQWDLDGVIGETEYQLMHPDYYKAFNWVLKNYKPKHDVLTICQCSSAKPYYDNKTYKSMLVKPYGQFTDFAAISNPGIIPYDVSNFYPYRYDEWNGTNEKKYKQLVNLSVKYQIVNMCRFIRFQRKMKYKHIITYIPNPFKQILFNKIIDNNIDNLDSVLKNGISDSLRKKYVNSPEYKKMHGLIYSRIGGWQETVDSYAKALSDALTGDEKDKMLKIHKAQQEKKLGTQEIKKLFEDSGLDFDGYYISESYGQPEYKIISDISYSDIMSKFKKVIDGNMKDPSIQKSDKGLYYKAYYFTVLDILLYGLDGNLIEDIDGRYHKLTKELKKDKDWIDMGNCLFAYKPLLENDSLEMSKIEKEAEKLKLVWHKPKIEIDWP